MSLGAMIRDKRKQLGLTQAQLGEIVGVSLHSIHRLETGSRQANIPELTSIAQALGLSEKDVLSLAVQELPPLSDGDIARNLYELNTKRREAGLPLIGPTPLLTQGLLAENSDTKKDPLEGQEGHLIKDVMWVPLISSTVTVSAGNGCPCESVEWESEETIPVTDGNIIALFSEKCLLSMRVEGDSMEPQIEDGDIVLFHKTSDWVPGNMTVVYLDGKLFVKGILKGPEGKLLLRSQNKNYEDLIVTPRENDFFVYGRVLEIISRKKPKPLI